MRFWRAAEQLDLQVEYALHNAIRIERTFARSALLPTTRVSQPMQIIVLVQPVDLNDQNVEFRQVGGHPCGQLGLGQPFEPARNG